jgi:hypothetical protein
MPLPGDGAGRDILKALISFRLSGVQDVGMLGVYAFKLYAAS